MNNDKQISAIADNENTTSASSRNAVRYATGALIAAGGLYAHGAVAQTQETPVVELEQTAVKTEKVKEISSPKFTAPLLDTPQTVSIITDQLIQQQNARNLTEVLRNTPGITFNAGENGFVSGPSNFSLRGFDTSGSVYIDGMRDSGNYLRDTFNVQQVEVVKGAAADNGRGTAGGYVNIVTKTPELEKFVRSTVGVTSADGSKPFYRGTVDVNQTISDTAAVRVNGMWQHGGVPGRGVAENKGWGIAPSVSLGLGTDTRYTLSYVHQEQNNRPDYGVPGAFIKGMKEYDPTLDAKKLRKNFYGLNSDFDDVTSDGVTFRVEHDFNSNLKLSNQSRWTDTHRKAHFTVPFSYDKTTRKVVTQRQGYNRTNTLLANNTNLDIKFETGSVRHEVATGLELSHEESKAKRYPTQSNPGTGAPISVFNPDSNRAGAWNVVSTESNRVRIDNVGIYAYDTASLNEKWDIVFGGRIDYYDLKLQSRDAKGRPTGVNYSKDKFTYGGKVGVVYKVADNGSVYVSAGIAALPPGAFLSNPDISRTGDGAFPGADAGMNSKDARTQYSVNYEVGTKWDFLEGRLSTTLALFHTERYNVAIGNGYGTALLGYGKQIVQGAELGVSGKITDGWEVFGGLLLMDSERKHSDWIDSRLRHGRVSGDQLAFTPHVTANLWTTYTFPIGLTFGAGFQYVGSSYLGRPDNAERIIPNGNVGKLPSYWVFNGLVGYQINDNFSVRLNVDNIFDELYAVSSNWPGSRVAIGSPRTFTISADIRF
jgi:catecholate siderophore receptor